MRFTHFSKYLLIIALSSYLFINSINTSPRTDIHKQTNVEIEIKNTLPNNIQKVCDVPNSLIENQFYIDFIDENFWIGYGKEQLWATYNAGNKWQLIRETDGGLLPSYEFVNQQIGWSWNRIKNYVEKTLDGGASWEKVSTPISEDKGVVHSIQFLPDGKTGWLTGGFYRLPTKEEKNVSFPINQSNSDGTKVLEGVIYSTKDGGKTWHKEFSGGGWRIYGLFIFSEKRLLAFTDTTAYLTEDSGKKWQPIRLNKACVRKEFLDENRYIELGGFDTYDAKNWWLGYGDTILKSLDGGRSWCEILNAGGVDFDTSFRRTSFDTFNFVNPKLGYGLGGDGYIYKTDDGGFSWKRITSEMRYNDMAFLKPDKLFLVDRQSIYRLFFNKEK